MKKSDKQFIKSYILSCIDAADYGLELNTDKEKIAFLLATFRKEYGHEIKRRGEFVAFQEWCAGLPTCFGIAFTNFDILDLAKKQGSLSDNPTEKEEDNILDNYWRYIAQNVMELERKLCK